MNRDTSALQVFGNSFQHFVERPVRTALTELAVGMATPGDIPARNAMISWTKCRKVTNHDTQVPHHASIPHPWEDSEQLDIVSIATVRETMWADKWVWSNGVYLKEKGSQCRALGNSCAEMMGWGFSLSRKDSNQDWILPEVPISASTGSIGLQRFTIWKAAGRSGNMRTVGWPVALLRVSASENTAVSVDWPLLRPDWCKHQ